MIGLAYLLDINNLQHKQLAEMLGVGKATISSWINGKRLISVKHYEKLKDIFKVPEEYFQKELTELDKLNLQKMKIESDMFQYTYKDVIWDNETQQEVEVEHIGTNIPYEQIEILDLNIREKKVFNNINTLITDRTENAKDECDYINKKSEVLEIFEILVEVMDEEYIPDGRIKDILDSIKIVNGKILANRLFVKKLSAVIKEQIIRDRRIAEENIRKTKELIEAGVYDEEEWIKDHKK